jgi:guanylate kinase
LTANYIGIFPPNIETLEKRLLYRNTEAIEVINKRLQEGSREVTEMKKSDIFDFTIVNDDFNTSYKIFRDAVVSLYPNLDKI